MDEPAADAAGRIPGRDREAETFLARARCGGNTEERQGQVGQDNRRDHQASS